MKKWMSLVAVALFSLTCFAGSALAANGECNRLYDKAFKGMKKDKKCGQYVAQWASAVASMRASCRNHRDNIRKCNLAKRHKAKACRGQKRTCKTVCKDQRKACKRRCTRNRPNCVRACPRGKRGKNCRKSCQQCVRSCNKLRRKCKRVCTGVSRRCLQASRRVAHSCRSQARTLSAFRTCQSARAMSRKAGSKIAGCAWRYFKDALICSGKDALKFLQKNK